MVLKPDMDSIVDVPRFPPLKNMMKIKLRVKALEELPEAITTLMMHS